MNILRPEKREAIVGALVEGNSIRSTSRLTGTHIETVLRHLRIVGEGCARLLDERMRNLRCQRVQVDEAWTFVQKKQRHLRPTDDPAHAGDFWLFVGLDADSKLIPSFRIGKRDSENTTAFIRDLASRVSGRIQLSSDLLELYVNAVEEGFGGDVDYGRIVKSYEAEPIGPGRYSPPKVVSVARSRVVGNPDPAHISTSYVERSNLTLRMAMRRFTRLTNGFSKKVEYLKAAVALHLAHYNLVRRHLTLRVTPAMAAGVTDRLWSIRDLLNAAE
jgi:IS1 family transposase